MSLITIKDLHKRFNPGTINEVHALKGINLEVNEGDWITIIGTNGSGKSTLLNAIAGAFLPDEGQITIEAKDVTHLRDNARANKVARVFQNPFKGTAPNMTIAENLHLAGLRGKKRYPFITFTKSQRRFYSKQIKQLEMNLENRMGNIIGTLSGGQRQAITLLIAVMTKPKVLLLDEHTAALDPKTAQQVIKLTEKFIKQDDLTTIMITHSMKQALEMGNRTIMMNKGEIVEDLNLEAKKDLTVNDLLDKFSDLRKVEQLTEEMRTKLSSEYI